MKHLDFVDELNKLGVSIRTTKIQGKEHKVYIPSFFTGKTNNIIIKDFNLTWENCNDGNPLKELIRLGIDSGTWKHSWHDEIIPENYNKFREIIQEMIINKSKQIEELLLIYFQLQYEMSNNK